MNLKKIFSLLLAMVMVLSLVACGNKEDAKGNDTTVGATENVEATEPTVDAEALQEYYEKYFDSDDYQFVGTSFTATTEGVELVLSEAKDGTGVFGMNMGTVQFEIYKTDTGEQYAHFVQSATMKEDGTVDTEAVDAWYLYKATQTEDGAEPEDMFASMSEDVTIESLTNVQGSIVDVKYEKTENGIDYVKVVVPNTEYVTGKVQKQYEISFEIEGETFTAQCESTIDGEVETTYMTNAVLPDGWSMDFVNIDMANKKITNSRTDTTIDLTIVSEVDTTPAENNELEFRIDSKTHMVVSIYGLDNGQPTEVTFSNPDTIEFTVPETVEECDSETLAMLYLAVLFSAMG